MAGGKLDGEGGSWLEDLQYDRGQKKSFITGWTQCDIEVDPDAHTIIQPLLAQNGALVLGPSLTA